MTAKTFEEINALGQKFVDEIRLELDRAKLAFGRATFVPGSRVADAWKQAERDAIDACSRAESLAKQVARSERARKRLEDALNRVYAEVRELLDMDPGPRIYGRVAAIEDFAAAALRKGSYAPRKKAER